MWRRFGRATSWLMAVLVALGWGLPAALRGLGPAPYVAIGTDQGAWLGHVAGGQFWPVGRAANVQPFDLTGIAMQEARSPEAARPDLGPYEGRVITVQGHNGGGWLYQARIVWVASRAQSWWLHYAYGSGR